MGMPTTTPPLTLPPSLTTMPACPHLVAGRCVVASSAIGVDVLPKPTHCNLACKTRGGPWMGRDCADPLAWAVSMPFKESRRVQVGQPQPVPAPQTASGATITPTPLSSPPPQALLPWSEKGPAMWAELHGKIMADQDWLDSFTARIPCGECKGHWSAWVKANPPDFGGGWYLWTVAAHNAVNERLGKPRFVPTT